MAIAVPKSERDVIARSRFSFGNLQSKPMRRIHNGIHLQKRAQWVLRALAARIAVNASVSVH